MSRILRAIFRHLDIKVAALLLAVITWYYVTTAGIDERRLAGVAVRALNPPPDIALLSQDVRAATLVVRGPRRELEALKVPELFAVLDLRDVTLGAGEPPTMRVPLTTRHLRAGRDAESAERLSASVILLRAEPDAVSFTLDRVGEALLDVEVVTEGEPAPGFTLKKAAQGGKVTVRGPSRLLQRLTAIRTEPIRVDGLRERLQRRVALQRQVAGPEYQAVPIRCEPDSVEVTLDVVATPEEKTVERVPVRLTGVPSTVAVVKEEVREVTVRLSGPGPLVRDIDASSLAAEVSLEGTQAPARGVEATTVFLRRENIRQLAGGTSTPLAREIELLDVRPRAVPLTLDRMGTRTLPVRAVREGSPAEDYEVSQITVVPDQVAVRGPESVLKDLEAIETLPVAVTGLRERLRRTVRLVETVDAGPFRGVRVEPSQQAVDVVIAVAEQRVEKALTGLPVHVLVRPEVAMNIRIELDRRTVGPVTFVGPRSRMKDFSAEDVTAFVLLDITEAADLRPTAREVRFHLRDPQVRLAPDSKPISVKIEFPPPEPPKKKE